VAAQPHHAFANECAQSSYALITSNFGAIATSAPGLHITIPSSQNLWFAGVLDPGWGILYQYYDLRGNFIFNNLENSAGDNCVLNQRSHTAAQATGGYIGTLNVYAYFETPEDHGPNDLAPRFLPIGHPPDVPG